MTTIANPLTGQVMNANPNGDNQYVNPDGPLEGASSLDARIHPRPFHHSELFPVANPIKESGMTRKTASFLARVGKAYQGKNKTMEGFVSKAEKSRKRALRTKSYGDMQDLLDRIADLHNSSEDYMSSEYEEMSPQERKEVAREIKSALIAGKSTSDAMDYTFRKKALSQ